MSFDWPNLILQQFFLPRTRGREKSTPGNLFIIFLGYWLFCVYVNHWSHLSKQYKRALFERFYRSGCLCQDTIQFRQCIHTCICTMENNISHSPIGGFSEGPDWANFRLHFGQLFILVSFLIK
jgi:hypothetical protein